MYRFWVIRKQPYRENSALLTVLADNDRLTRCIARGGSTASEFQPLFGLLTSKKNLASLSKIEPAGSRVPLQGTQLISALYLNEITNWILPEGAEEEGLFDLYTDSVKGISLKSFDALRRFERFLLEAAGTYPVLDVDRNGKRLHDQRYYRLHDFQELVEVNSGEVDALYGADWRALSMGIYTEAVTAAHAKWLHRSLLNHTLGGRRLVSREMLSEVRKSK
ncbi:MAG: hypothetical protein CMD99_07305 [Gammaproteobacteria bacterium]|nr:hypothetical protein [Gammaproteobacteria bacterium]